MWQKNSHFKFKNCISKGTCVGVEEEVTKFIVLHPYLQTIAKITKRPKFSYPVIESYWLGNKLLKKFKAKDYSVLLDYFKKQGVPDFFIEELKLKKPKQFIPSHLFHVLHVGVGKASGAVPFNLNSINNCMIRWGEVRSIAKNKTTINLNSLKKSSNKYSLSKIKTQIPFNPALAPNLKKGDTVAVHWQMVVKILEEEEINNLEYWTKKVLKNL